MANEIKDLIDYMKSDAAERRKAEKEAIEKDRQQLEALRQGFEAQGQNADDNAKFRSADIALQRRELALRKEDATGKSAQEEIAKEERALREKEGGMLNRIAIGITDLGKDFKAKAANVGKGILKGTLLAGLFLAAAAFFQSPLFGKMIDFITGTLIPKLKFFYDGFFGPNGGFIEGFKRLFSDDSGIGSILLGLGTVTTIIIGMKVASKFSTLAAGFSRIGGFLGNLGSRLKGMVLPKAPGGLPAGGAPAGGGLSKTGQPGRVTAFAKGVKDIGVSAGKGIGGFISGILKGIGSGLTAIANPAALIGLAAVSAAIIAISAALRIAAPAFEPIGKMMESFGESIKRVFTGIGNFVESTGKAIKSVIVGIGEAVGNVVDKITKMRTAGTEATTKQIKELSKIPADKLFGAAAGIDAMKAALDDFGGGTFSKISDSLFGGDGPIEKIVDLAKKVPELMRAAEAINLISAAGGDYEIAKAEIDRRKRVAELEKRLGGKLRDNTRNKLQAELGALQAQYTESNFALAKRGDSMQLGKLFTSSQPGIVTFSEKTAEIMRSALNKSAQTGGSVNINAPSDNKVTNSSTSNTSSNTAITNNDPIVSMAMGADF